MSEREPFAGCLVHGCPALCVGDALFCASHGALAPTALCAALRAALTTGTRDETLPVWRTLVQQAQEIA